MKEVKSQLSISFSGTAVCCLLFLPFACLLARSQVSLFRWWVKIPCEDKVGEGARQEEQEPLDLTTIGKNRPPSCLGLRISL